MSAGEELRIEYVPLAKLPGSPGNPKKHAIKGIIGSMLAYGFVESVIRDDRTGRLLAGHGRKEALLAIREALTAGDKAVHVPAKIRVDPDGEWSVPTTVGWASTDDEQAEQVLVALNAHVVAGGWDEVRLAPILQRALAREVPPEILGYARRDVEGLLRRVNGTGGGTGGDPGAGNYKEQYGVIVICANAKEQEAVYERLKGMGMQCRVVVT